MNTKTLITYEKLWLWLARRPFGWPRATGKPDPCSGISFSEFLPNGYNGVFRKDRCKNGGGVLIVIKQEYTITDLDLYYSFLT